MTDATPTTDEIVKAQRFVIKLLISILDKNIPGIGLAPDPHDAVDKLEMSKSVDNHDPVAIRSILLRRS